jgi:mannose-1-phosphate guanylyltransferase
MPSTPDAMLLCGGAGLRLRSVIGNAPKGLANIAGRPFLELLLRQLRQYGFSRAILAVGYQKEMIYSHFGEQAFGLHLAYSVESYPLGTGGALRNAADLVETASVMIMNGDSYTDADLSKFVAHYRKSKVDISILIVPADGRNDCGSVLIDGTGKIASFEEKQGQFHAPYANAGVYMMSKELLSEIPDGLAISLEQQLIPQWLLQGRCIKGFVSLAKCIDIGTPERYWRAQHVLAAAGLDGNESQHEDQL